MQIGYIGLGKMGKNMVLRVLEHGHEVVAWNRSPDVVNEVVSVGAKGADSLESLVDQVAEPRTIWLMLPAGAATEELLTKLTPLLSPGDTVIEGGNAFFKDSRRRSANLAKNSIKFIDVGVSGGPGGARNGACLMIGGTKENYDSHLDLFKSIAAPNAYQFFEGAGAGHFVKMVHNGIEYGMMQAIAEGFAVMKYSEYNINLMEAASIYNNGSVIESRLVGWLKSGFEEYGMEMSGISGSVAHSGEGAWTVDTAKELSVDVPVIEDALEFRKLSQSEPSFTGKIVSLLRNQFGGHNVSIKK